MKVPEAFRSCRRGRQILIAGYALMLIGMAVRVCGVEAAEPTPAPAASEPFHYDAKGRRDPFSALVRNGKIIGGKIEGSGDAPVLQGILWDPRGISVALLDNAEYKVGDQIREYQVAEIRRDGVVLKKGEESVIVQIAFDKSPTNTKSSSQRHNGR